MKDLRKSKGLTRKELAKKFRVIECTVSHWENGQTDMYLSKAVELVKFYDISMDIFLNYWIVCNRGDYMSEQNLETFYDIFVEEKRDYLNESLSDFSEFNLVNPLETYSFQLEEYMFEQVCHCFRKVLTGENNTEKAFYSNILAKFLGDFLDLYAQILNNFYDLKLVPLRKDFDPGLIEGGIVSQALIGVGNSVGSPVSIQNVISKLETDYSSNEYFDNIKTILDSDEMTTMKILRNYVSHYQLIFSKFSNSYQFYNNGESIKKFNFQGSSLDEREYTLFLSLAKEVISKQIDLIYNFNKMYTDKKMIKVGERIKKVYEYKCPTCNLKIPVTDALKFAHDKELELFIAHNDCNSKECLEWINNEYEVHPEKYDFIFVTELENIEKKAVVMQDKEGNRL